MTTPTSPDARLLGFVADHDRGVLATVKRDGRPQLSNIAYTFGGADGDGLLRISVTADRVKTRNLLADPRASVHVTSADFWSWVVVEGDAELTPPAADPDDATADELVAYYRSASGEHPDWAEYRRAMVAERRVLIRVRPTHAYGQLPG